MKKIGTKRLIIMIAAGVVVIAAVVVLALGFTKGWFKNNGGEEENKDYSVSYQYDTENKNAVLAEEYYSKDGELEYKVYKNYADTEKKQLNQDRYVDAKENVTKIINYDPEGKITSVDEYADSKISVQHEYQNGEKTGIHSKFDYTDAGSLVSTITYDGEERVIKKVERQYKKFGDEEKITLYYESDGNDKQISKTVYNYDEKGNDTKTVFYDAEGMTGYVVNEYDAQGRKTKMNQFGKDEKLIDYRLFKYAQDGTVTEEYHKAGE